MGGMRGREGRGGEGVCWPTRARSQGAIKSPLSCKLLFLKIDLKKRGDRWMPFTFASCYLSFSLVGFRIMFNFHRIRHTINDKYNGGKLGSVMGNMQN